MGLSSKGTCTTYSGNARRKGGLAAAPPVAAVGLLLLPQRRDVLLWHLGVATCGGALHHEFMTCALCGQPARRARHVHCAPWRVLPVPLGVHGVENVQTCCIA